MLTSDKLKWKLSACYTKILSNTLDNGDYLSNLYLKKVTGQAI